jgi:4-methyl-5(b-hydroxyethyl)-thiazole monophosphate biosynthesis
MPGTLNLKRNAKVLKAIDYCVNNDKYVAAICAAPSILGEFGYLKGKNATCYPGFEDELKGANYVDAKVIKDGIFITSKGPGTALDFGYFLLSLFDKEASATLREDMQFN